MKKVTKTTAAPVERDWRGREIVRCQTQSDLDAALARTDTIAIWLCGTGWFVVSDSAHVVAWDSAHVEARDSAHVEARDSAHVEARDSAHVEALGSAHVVAWDSAHVVAWDSAHVVASKYVAVHRHSTRSTVRGGVVIEIVRPTTVAEWCDYYGVSVQDGIATVYKTVRADYRSAHGLLYAPGSTPIAPDWDGGRQECGGGLHFSPRPLMAQEFDVKGVKFLACPVRLDAMRAPRKGDSYPQKIKAQGCAGPIVEVDRYGTPIRMSEPRA